MIWGPASKCAKALASPGGTCVSSCIGRSPLWGHPSTPLRGSECRCRESNVRSHLERQELRHTLKQALIQRTYSCALKHLSASNLLVSEGRNKSRLRWPPTKHQAKHSQTEPGHPPKGALTTNKASSKAWPCSQTEPGHPPKRCKRSGGLLQSVPDLLPLQVAPALALASAGVPCGGIPQLP